MREEQRDLHAQSLLAQAGRKLDRSDRVAAEHEIVVVDSDLIDLQGLSPRLRQALFEVVARRHVDRSRLRSACRSEEHTSELQSLTNLVCRLLLEKKKKNTTRLDELNTSITYKNTV